MKRSAVFVGATCAWLASSTVTEARAQASSRPELFVEGGAAFVPFAIDVPLMVGGGVRLARTHELWTRFGFMPTGDDQGRGFVCGGYRAVLRPGKLVRPVLGGLIAGLPATCFHDAMRQPSCTATPLFIFAATLGVRFEPTPWLGVASVVTLGNDSYPNPFGMMELDVTFLVPAL